MNLSEDFERNLRRAFKTLLKYDREAAKALDDSLAKLFTSYRMRGKAILGLQEALREAKGETP